MGAPYNLAQPALTRSDLFAIAAKHGYERGRPVGVNARKAIEVELRAHLGGAQGQRALALAPGVASDSGMRPMTVDDAVGALLEELQT